MTRLKIQIAKNNLAEIENEIDEILSRISPNKRNGSYFDKSLLRPFYRQEYLDKEGEFSLEYERVVKIEGILTSLSQPPETLDYFSSILQTGRENTSLPEIAPTLESGEAIGMDVLVLSAGLMKPQLARLKLLDSIGEFLSESR